MLGKRNTRSAGLLCSWKQEFLRGNENLKNEYILDMVGKPGLKLDPTRCIKADVKTRKYGIFYQTSNLQSSFFLPGCALLAKFNWLNPAVCLGCRALLEKITQL